MNGMLFDVNDPAIIAVGYRVNSVCATQFRQWATSVPVINISPRQKAAFWPVQSFPSRASAAKTASCTG